MCTSFTFLTDKKEFFLARTMDFSVPLDEQILYVPRNHTFQLIDGVTFKGQYGFIGAGREFSGLYFADGMNEKGFSIASLYFTGQARYTKSKDVNKINMSSADLVSWALANVSSIADFKEKFENITIIDVENPVLKTLVPLHWILSDSKGNTVVLEITETGTHFYDNQVGVMTNSPDFPWHLTHLNQFSNLQPKDFGQKKYGEMVTVTESPGSGALGLPGDYTSASRFVRAAFLREYADKSDGLISILHILNSVDIPKGVKVKSNDQIDYTLYKSAMNLTQLRYYFMRYEDISVQEFSITDDLLKETTVKTLA